MMEMLAGRGRPGVTDVGGAPAPGPVPHLPAFSSFSLAVGLYLSRIGQVMGGPAHPLRHQLMQAW